MAYRVYIDDQVNCVFVQHFGTYEIGEEMKQLNSMLDDSAYLQNMSLMRDVTQTSFPDSYNLDWFRQHATSTMALTDIDLGIGRKVAWVLGSVNDYKIVHQWAVIGRLNHKVMERRPFRAVAKAMKWLEIPDDYAISYPEAGR